MPITQKSHPAEYTAYNNMKRRMKAKGLPLPKAFDTFGGFISEVGHRPDPTYSLDRIHNNNPAYEPGNVRWASRTTQSNNRGNTLYLTYSGSALPQFTGQTKPLAEWARILGLRQDLLRQRRSRGWSDNDNIEGKRSTAAKVFREMTLKELVEYRPWTKANAERNERSYLVDRKDNESRLAYRARRLGWEATDKWQFLLSLAMPKDAALNHEVILTAKRPEFCFAPYTGVSQEQFQFGVEEWRRAAVRWRDAERDLSEWSAQVDLRRGTASLPGKSRNADAALLKHLRSFEGNDANEDE